LIRYQAPWIVPISGPPIRDGWVVVDRDRIVALGGPTTGDRAWRSTSGLRDMPLRDVVVMPGLVNAHTHLELSHMRDEVPPSWVYIEMTDRKTNTKYKSNLAETTM